MENNMAVPQKIKNRVTMPNRNLGIEPRELKTGSQRYLYTRVHSSIILGCNPRAHQWLSKQNVVDMCMEYHLALKRQKILTCAVT